MNFNFNVFEFEERERLYAQNLRLQAERDLARLDSDDWRFRVRSLEEVISGIIGRMDKKVEIVDKRSKKKWSAWDWIVNEAKKVDKARRVPGGRD